MVARTYAASVAGLEVSTIEIEVYISGGISSFAIVGLPDAAIQESRERVRSAIKNSGFTFPRTRITVNLAPADSRKSGPSFDLPIAIGLLHDSLTFDANILQHSLFLGELALDGRLRPVASVLPIALFAKKHGYTHLFVPQDNAAEAALVEGVEVISLESLHECVAYLCSQKSLTPVPRTHPDTFGHNTQEAAIDFADIIGQSQAKRALTIAAAGGHNIAMEGPPGSGKTMLAKALVGILPKLTFDEMIEISQVYSVVGLLSKDYPLVCRRPFRSVHHTASAVSIVGGGSQARPGEISLAHRGVLFLDEFLEFPTPVLETLRQPLEDGDITVTRAQARYTYPAACMLVAAFNPTPSGYDANDDSNTSTQHQIERYRSKLSGPLLDRIDLFLYVPRVPVDEIREKAKQQETTASIQKHVQDARDVQDARFQDSNITCNADMSTADIHRFCHLDTESVSLLQNATQSMQLSTRAYFRIIRIARTIADLENRTNIQTSHIAEALSYRKK